MSDDRIDLSSLDLSRDPARMERMVASITWRARPELMRRRNTRPVTAVEMVAAWFRPALAAAAAVAAISVGAIAMSNRSGEVVQAGAYMSGSEVPVSLTTWYEEGSSPTAAELLVAANEGGN